MIARLLVGAVMLACVTSAFAQGNQQPPSPQKPAEEQEKQPNFEEQVVVSASRSEQALVNAGRGHADHIGKAAELARLQHG